jgi:hypothetical protein
MNRHSLATLAQGENETVKQLDEAHRFVDGESFSTIEKVGIPC